MSSEGRDQKLDRDLAKTREGFIGRLGRALIGKSQVDDEVLDNLEEILIASDVGVQTTMKIIERIQDRVARDKYMNTRELDNLLREEIVSLLSDGDMPVYTEDATKPYVIMVVGVNGVGKTTTIGKLAARYKADGRKVLLGAADTFRAAAVEQVRLWGERVGVPVVSKGMNTDPASVAFDAIKKGEEEGFDVVIIDTAGRLHTKVNLMNELARIRKVTQKLIPAAPHEVLLVLDGSTGQNALAQAAEFTKATQVTAIAVTKLDGTARGGVVIGISDTFKIPIRYIGTGERTEDLLPFDKRAFVESLFRKDTSGT